MYKKIAIFFTLAFIFSFIFQISFAQDGSGFNTSGLSGGEEDQANFYLQKAIAEDNSLKTKAEQFNGKLSGVYDGQKLSCPYAFERDLFVGSKGEDVRLLQVLLNSDKRTLISLDGAGSVGKETNSFGESTKTALKKFQALFIEYVGVANGRFGPRTRTVMNALCNGENKPSTSTDLEVRQNKNIYDNIFSVQRGAVPGGIVTTTRNGGDLTPPRISLSANVSTVKMGDPFKVILNASEEIVPITPDSFIVDGGSVKEIRKLSKTSYTATININEDAKKVLIQIEADKIEDLFGNKNDNASNEITIKVVGVVKTVGEETVSNEGGINSLLDKIIASAPTSTLASTPVQTYDCNGNKIPVTQPCQQQMQTVCTTQPNPYTGFPMQQCQQIPAQQLQAQQQAQQNQQLGQLLGGLLGKAFGGGDNKNGAGPQGQIPSGPAVPWVNPDRVPPATVPAQDPAVAVKTEQTLQNEIEKRTAELKTEKSKLEKIIADTNSSAADKTRASQRIKEIDKELEKNNFAKEISEYREAKAAREKDEQSYKNLCEKDPNTDTCNNLKTSIEKKKALEETALKNAYDKLCTPPENLSKNAKTCAELEKNIKGDKKSENDLIIKCPEVITFKVAENTPITLCLSTASCPPNDPDIIIPVGKDNGGQSTNAQMYQVTMAGKEKYLLFRTPVRKDRVENHEIIVPSSMFDLYKPKTYLACDLVKSRAGKCDGSEDIGGLHDLYVIKKGKEEEVFKKFPKDAAKRCPSSRP